ncbi:MAG: hypothetical protein KDD40_00900 [Bdellovibrionales bacterium]|nr:hypothetical protein [Bdellovibrionales bacterium]
MPDGFGLPTGEEIAHYEEVLNKGTAAVKTMQTSPFDRSKFDTAHKELQTAYDSMKNPHIWANSSGRSLLFDFPGHLKNLVDRGMTTDSLPSLQNELKLAGENLHKLKEIKANNNPMKNALAYFLNKKD